MSEIKHAHLILGDQLFPREYLKEFKKTHWIFMAEDEGLCTHFRYHKMKLVFFLAAMREYAEDLKKSDFKVEYRALTKKGKDHSYEDKLSQFIREKDLRKLTLFEIEDKFFEDRILKCLSQIQIEYEIRETPKFLFSREDFADYRTSSKKPFMKTFYERQRQKTRVLMTETGKPLGGQFSFDSENRKKMPKNESPPLWPEVQASKTTKAVIEIVNSRFSDHPGHTEGFWLPVKRSQALGYLRNFIDERLEKFGDYQDAMTPRFDFNFHSVLSPFLNCGLITPQEVLTAVLKAPKSIPLNAKEGFIRQLMGWREFVRGIYREFSEKMDESNFFHHKRKLSSHWYEGTTGLLPVDDSIKKAVRLSYCHHIERLMILSNVMLLTEIDPREVHRWFMEMFVDSADWVMGPNVYGMGQFSDGGIFATKPYISGSNYILKMSDYKKGDWCDVYDGLFWSFLAKHSQFFQRNPRMNMLLKTLDKMDSNKKKKIFGLANDFKSRVTN